MEAEEVAGLAIFDNFGQCAAVAGDERSKRPTDSRLMEDSWKGLSQSLGADQRSEMALHATTPCPARSPGSCLPVVPPMIVSAT